MGGLTQNVQKPPPGKNVQKSQGQIFQEFVECQEFQECQGQISQGQIFQEFVECQGQMSRSNAKVKNFRNVWNVRNVKTENYGSVTFSENRKSNDVIEQGFFPSKQGLSRVMSHQIAIVNHGRVIFLDQSKASHFFSQKKFTKCETFQ